MNLIINLLLYSFSYPLICFFVVVFFFTRSHFVLFTILFKNLVIHKWMHCTSRVPIAVVYITTVGNQTYSRYMCLIK